LEESVKLISQNSVKKIDSPLIFKGWEGRRNGGKEEGEGIRGRRKGRGKGGRK
jgi:hypothetical protein